MGFPEVADVARKFSVMVRVQGPDPKGLKMRNHAFHLYNSGKTTLSASGMIFPASTGSPTLGSNSDVCSSEALVLTTSSVIEPFLSQQYRENLSKAVLGKPQLISGVQIDILHEEKCVKEGKIEAVSWIPAELLMMVSIPVLSAAVESIISASFGSLDRNWEIGWSLAYEGHGPQQVNENIGTGADSSHQSLWPLKKVESHDANLTGQLATRIAVLAIPSKFSLFFSQVASVSFRRGDLILAMGSPFGILSPLHFFNNVSVGSIGNIYPPNTFRSLLMVDIRCLPGMEGSPVFSECGRFIGLLTAPLRQKNSGAEVQMVIPWEAIASVLDEFLKNFFLSSIEANERGNLNMLNCSTSFHLDETGSSFHEQMCSNSRIPTHVEKAMNSICLIKNENGSWASAVLLNKQGLILTNAHFLEPWRFGKTAAYSDGCEGRHRNEQSKRQQNVGVSLRHENTPFGHNSASIKHRNIHVRLDSTKSSTWTDAKVVYISKGPLDVALLQLQVSSGQLCPISIDFKCPEVGSRVYVIGHGLFGPRYDASISLLWCSFQSNQATRPSKTASHNRSLQDRYPAMLQTTAAVHPGSSGGAVINSEGHLIGLVTSNAKHGGGKLIPHMNFSIPCAALEPAFNFSKDMEDLAILEELNKPDEHLSSVWSLAPPLHPKPENRLFETPLQDDAKAIKGSRFAKFIAERANVQPPNGADANSAKVILPRSRI